MRTGCPATGGGRRGRRFDLGAATGRRLFLVLAVVALAGGAIGVGPAAVAGQGAATVDADTLNVRAEPGTWSWVVAQASFGEPISVLSGPTIDGWYQVGFGGVVGWVHGWYLSIGGAPGWAPFDGTTSSDPVVSPNTAQLTAATTPPVEAAVQPAPGVAPAPGVGSPSTAAWVSANPLSVLAAPADGSAVLDVYNPGDAVTVTGPPVDGFVPVTHWSGQAWVWAGALSYQAPPLLERWIDVNRTAQMVTLYEGGLAVASYWGAMGTDPSDSGFFATAIGTYYVYEKYGELSWTNWGNAWVRHWVAFDPNRLNGFHSYSMDWNGQVLAGGDGPTGGCVALAPWAAEHLFSFVQLGTRVEVHW